MPFDSVKLNDGNEIPAIAYGTGSKMKGHDVTTYVEQAIELGFSHLDTAAFYQTEPFVGNAIKESGLQRSDFFVTTKYSLGSISDGIRNSLSNLGLKHVDLYLIHHPRTVPDLTGAWTKFEAIKENGLAKSIGVSNFNVEQLQTIVKHAKIIPAVNQISLNPYNYAETKPVLDFCAKHKIVVEAYSSLAPITTYPGGPVDKPVTAAASRRGATPAQIIFLWVKAKGAVIVTTSSSKDRMREYLDTFELSPLTAEEVAAIDEAAAQGPPSFILTKIRRLSKRDQSLIVVVFIFTLLILLRML